MNIHYSNLFLTVGDCLEIFSYHCQILHHTQLSLIMKDIEIEYQSIDACPNDHTIYFRQYATILKSSQCGISIYRIDQVTKNLSRKVLCHIPIIPCYQ